MKYIPVLLAAPLAILAGCGQDDPAGSQVGQITRPATYQFTSRFDANESSVAYTGQTKRHLLIESLKAYIGNLDDTTFPNLQAGTVVGALEFFYDFKNSGARQTRPLDFTLGGNTPPLQETWGDLGSFVSLKEKFPEFDAGFDGGVVGYGDGTMTPEAVLEDMFADVEDLLITWVNGPTPVGPLGRDIAKPFVSPEGIDYQQLVQKYLSGAIAISQGTDDYLDDDIPGKGLQSDNEMQVAGQQYTALEHIWDEGFGYFGAARNYGNFTDDEIAKADGRADWQGANDSNQDGRIDFTSEYNFGHSVNAAKRDRGSVVPTDYTKTAFDAFLDGRTLIVNAGGNLDEAQLAELQGYRDAAVGAWERAVAATIVHYVNSVLQDMGKFTGDYDFLDHAKHWSELKGFALALQFNVNHSPMTTARFAELQGYIGDRPVLPTAEMSAQEAYKQSLIDARTLVGDVYGFDTANLGDAEGVNGW